MDKTQKRLKITKAAAKIFAQDGLERARVEDIAQEAGIGKGTIYLYFRDKQEILEEGIRYFARERVTHLKELLETYKDPKRKLITLLNLSVKISENNPSIFYMNYAAILSTHKDLRQRAVSEFFVQYVRLVEGIIREGIRKRVFRKLNPKVVALSIVLTQDLGNLLLQGRILKIRSKVIASELIKLISV